MITKLQEIIGLFVGFRKFIVMMTLILIGIIFRCKNLLTGDQFVQLLDATTVAFMASNSIERVGEVIKSYINSKGEKIEEVEAGNVSNANT